MATENLDGILNQLGLGPWNYIFFATSAMVPAVLPLHLIGSEFTNPPPEVFTCITDSNTTFPMNGTECMMWEDDGSGQLGEVECRAWKYDTSTFSNTVSMEWNLVCNRSSLRPWYQTIYTLGCLFGTFLAAPAANRLGRRWAIRMGSHLTLVLTTLLVVCPWIEAALTLRFLLGLSNTIMVCPAFMLTMEMCYPSLRPTVGVMLALPYALMMIILSGLAYCIHNWRYLQIAASTPSLLLFPLVCLVDESPRWLLVTGKVQESAKVLQHAARLNSVSLGEKDEIINTLDKIYKEQLSQSSSREASDSRCGSWLGGVSPLVENSIIRRISLTLLVIWLLQGVLYLGIPLGSDSFSSPFLYMALMGCAEIPAYTVTAPITKRLGRRIVAGSGLLIAGTLILIIMILNETGLYNEWADLILMMFAYLFTCTAYQVNFIYAPELFPTTVRPWGTTACTLMANIGFSIPPFLQDSIGSAEPWLTTTVFGVCGLISGALVFTLPETNGLPLPETVAELTQRLTGKDSQKVKPETVTDLTQRLPGVENYKSKEDQENYVNYSYKLDGTDLKSPHMEKIVMQKLDDVKILKNQVISTQSEEIK